MVRLKYRVWTLILGLLSCLGLFSGLEGMDYKYSPLGEQKAQADQKHASQENKPKSGRLPIKKDNNGVKPAPTFAGTVAAYKANAAEPKKKSGALRSTLLGSLKVKTKPTLCVNKTGKVKTPEWHINDELFKQLVSNKDIDSLYALSPHPVIKKNLQDNKTFFEVNAIIDAQGKSILDQAIANDDAAFIGRFNHCLGTDERNKAIRKAAAQGKCLALLALVPKVKDKIDEIALLEHFKTIGDLTVAEIDTYFATQALAKKHRLIRSQCSHKVLTDPKSPLAKLPKAVLGHIHDMISPIRANAQSMHPQLRSAAEKNDLGKMFSVIEQGVDLEAQTNYGKNTQGLLGALYPSTLFHPHYVDANKVKKIIHTSKLIKQDLQENEQQYDEDSIKVVERELSLVQDLQSRLEQALIGHVNKVNAHTGTILLLLSCGADPNCKLAPGDSLLLAGVLGKPAALKLLLSFGANPNATFKSQNGDPVPVLFQALFEDTEKMKLLLEHDANPNAFVRGSDDRKFNPLLWWAMIKNKPQHAKLLIKYGADLKALCDDEGPMVREAFLYDPFFLKLMLQNGTDQSTLRKCRTSGLQYPLFWWAMNHNKPVYAQLALDYGANPNACLPDGDPIGFEALFYEPIFLEMLLKKGLNPNVTIKATKDVKEYSLLYWALIKDKIEHFKLLLKYGADTNLAVPATDDDFQPGDLLFNKASVHDNPEFLKALLALKGKQENKHSSFLVHWHLLFSNLLGQTDKMYALLKHEAEKEKQQAAGVKKSDEHGSACTIQ